MKINYNIFFIFSECQSKSSVVKVGYTEKVEIINEIDETVCF